MSGSESELENVSSQPGPAKSFGIVPEDTKFKFKLFSSSWESDDLALLEKFAFILKKGKPLPYSADLKGIEYQQYIPITFTILHLGYNFKFSRELSASVEGFESPVMDREWFTFEQKCPESLKGI